jgi:hypothetical protein
MECACASDRWGDRRRDAGSSNGAEGNRTPDPLLAKQVLSQLSYRPDAGQDNLSAHLREGHRALAATSRRKVASGSSEGASRNSDAPATRSSVTPSSRAARNPFA